MHALLPCVAGRLAHCEAVRTWKRAQATARWPQSAGSLSCERLYREGSKGGVGGCNYFGAVLTTGRDRVSKGSGEQGKPGKQGHRNKEVR